MPRASAIFSKIPDVAVTGCLNSRWNRGADACPLASRCDFSTGTCCGDRRQCMPALHRLSISIEPGHRIGAQKEPLCLARRRSPKPELSAAADGPPLGELYSRSDRESREIPVHRRSVDSRCRGWMELRLQGAQCGFGTCDLPM